MDGEAESVLCPFLRTAADGGPHICASHPDAPIDISPFGVSAYCTTARHVSCARFIAVTAPSPAQAEPLPDPAKDEPVRDDVTTVLPVLPRIPDGSVLDTPMSREGLPVESGEASSQLPVITRPPDRSTVPVGDVELSGTALAGSTVIVFDYLHSVGRTAANSDGGWTITVPDVAPGDHMYYAQIAADDPGESLRSNFCEVRVAAIDELRPHTSDPGLEHESETRGTSTLSSWSGAFGTQIEKHAEAPASTLDAWAKAASPNMPLEDATTAQPRSPEETAGLEGAPETQGDAESNGDGVVSTVFPSFPGREDIDTGRGDLLRDRTESAFVKELSGATETTDETSIPNEARPVPGERNGKSNVPPPDTLARGGEDDRPDAGEMSTDAWPALDPAETLVLPPRETAIARLSTGHKEAEVAENAPKAPSAWPWQQRGATPPPDDVEESKGPVHEPPPENTGEKSSFSPNQTPALPTSVPDARESAGAHEKDAAHESDIHDMGVVPPVATSRWRSRPALIGMGAALLIAIDAAAILLAHRGASHPSVATRRTQGTLQPSPIPSSTTAKKVAATSPKPTRVPAASTRSLASRVWTFPSVRVPGDQVLLIFDNPDRVTVTVRVTAAALKSQSVRIPARSGAEMGLDMRLGGGVLRLHSSGPVIVQRFVSYHGSIRSFPGRAASR